MLHLYHSHAAQCSIICGISCLCWEALTHSCHFIVESSRPLYLWTHRRISWQRILNRTNCIEILVRVYSFQNETGSWNLVNPNQIHQIRIKLGSVMPPLANIHVQKYTCCTYIFTINQLHVSIKFQVATELGLKWHSPAACLRSHEDWNLLGNPLGIDRGTGQQMTHGASEERAAITGSFYASILVLLSSCHLKSPRFSNTTRFKL